MPNFENAGARAQENSKKLNADIIQLKKRIQRLTAALERYQREMDAEAESYGILARTPSTPPAIIENHRKSMAKIRENINKTESAIKDTEQEMENKQKELDRINTTLSEYYSKKGSGQIQHSELYHHGILGQKWGVRRYQNEDGSLTALGRKHIGQTNPRPNQQQSSVNETNSKNSHYHYKSLGDMSDQELRDVLNRMDMEKRYKDYIASSKQSEPTMTQKVLKATENVIATGTQNAGKEIVKNLAYYYGATSINKIAGHTIINTKISTSKKEKEKDDT